MSATEAQYRRWVLRHWSLGGWRIIVDRLETKRGRGAIARLVKDGHLENGGNEMYRLTDAGRAALAADDPAR